MLCVWNPTLNMNHFPNVNTIDGEINNTYVYYHSVLGSCWIPYKSSFEFKDCVIIVKNKEMLSGKNIKVFENKICEIIPGSV